MVRVAVEAKFPGLATSAWQLSSPSSGDYNCVAHAALDYTKWWWPHPDAYWPPGAPEEKTVVAFVEAFAKLGYHPCSDAGLEPGIAKIAIFTNAGGVPTHAARQLSSGLWTSKLGPWVDIEHELKGVEGAEYGTITLILCRELSSSNKLIKTVRNFLHWLAKAVSVRP